MAHLSPSVHIGGGILYAGVVKLADTLDLGSNAEWCAGSSPVTRTSLITVRIRSARILAVLLCLCMLWDMELLVK